MARILALIVWGLSIVACSPGSAPAEILWIGRVDSITGPLSFIITDPSGGPDSRIEVRLAELDAPVADAAETALARLLDGQEVGWLAGTGVEDRYGRRLAHVYVRQADGEGEGLWLQAELVASGAARVITHADNRYETARLLALEADARESRRGIWQAVEAAVRDTHPDGLAQHVGSVQLVEGRVVEATRLRSGRVYLNFGADYRTDFTVMIAAEDEPAFLSAGLDPLSLETRRIRVRGWVEDENGPMIRIDHPERIEILGD